MSRAVVAAGIVRETDAPPEWVIEYLERVLASEYRRGQKDALQSAADAWESRNHVSGWRRWVGSHRRMLVSVWLRQEAKKYR